MMTFCVPKDLNIPIYRVIFLIVLLIFVFFLTYDDFYSKMVYNKFLLFTRTNLYEFNRNNLSESYLEFNFNYKSWINRLGLNKKNLLALPCFSAWKFFENFAQHHLSPPSSLLRAPLPNGLNPSLVKCGDKIFIHPWHADYFFANISANITNPYILITHRGDDSVGSEKHLSYLNDSKIIMWYSTNAIGRHPKLRHIPIGIPYGSYGTPLFPDSTDILGLIRRPKPFYQKKNLIYSNFRIETNQARRLEAFNYMTKTFGNDSDVLIIRNKTSKKDFLLNTSDSKFIISPPGVGLDCWRTWEALALGTIPIVLRNEIEPLYEGMTVMVVNNWTEVTRNSLNEFQATRLKNLSRDGIPWRPKVWLRYWLNEIENILKEFDIIFDVQIKRATVACLKGKSDIAAPISTISPTVHFNLTSQYTRIYK